MRSPSVTGALSTSLWLGCCTVVVSGISTRRGAPPGRQPGEVVTRLASERFSWRRWWCPADEDPPVSPGFLDDPAGPFASYFDYALVELAQLDHVRCLVLLGEAGMGKSSELEVEEQRLRAARLPVVKFDLGAEPDVPSLRDTVLTSPEVTTRLRGMCGVGMPPWCVTDRRAAAISCRVSRHCWGRLGLARLPGLSVESRLGGRRNRSLGVNRNLRTDHQIYVMSAVSVPADRKPSRAGRPGRIIRIMRCELTNPGVKLKYG